MCVVWKVSDEACLLVSVLTQIEVIWSRCSTLQTLDKSQSALVDLVTVANVLRKSHRIYCSSGIHLEASGAFWTTCTKVLLSLAVAKDNAASSFCSCRRLQWKMIHGSGVVFLFWKETYQHLIDVRVCGVSRLERVTCFLYIEKYPQLSIRLDGRH